MISIKNKYGNEGNAKVKDLPRIILNGGQLLQALSKEEIEELKLLVSEQELKSILDKKPQTKSKK